MRQNENLSSSASRNSSYAGTDKGKWAANWVISNCFSEETKVIRESVLFPYFDVVFSSYEQGLVKPDKEIFYRCLQKLVSKGRRMFVCGRWRQSRTRNSEGAWNAGSSGSLVSARGHRAAKWT